MALCTEPATTRRRAGDRARRSRQGLMDRVRDVVANIRQNESAVLQARLAAGRRAPALAEPRLDRDAGPAVLLLGVFSAPRPAPPPASRSTPRRTVDRSNAALVGEIAHARDGRGAGPADAEDGGVGQLTGGIAHDFNNMLAVIISAMNLTQRKLARGETDIGQLRRGGARCAPARAANLTARLLAFSRQQPLAPQVVDANRLVAGMSDLLRRTLGEPIADRDGAGGGLWKTHADPSQLENAILNLAVNARDAMPDGGRLTIETANCHLDDAYAAAPCRGAAPGSIVLIAVSDTGTGMPPNRRASAFDPFFTTKQVGKGTGLGLSQVFGFVKQSGGHVKIYSEPGQGTTVKIYLPRYFGEDERARRHGTAPSKAGDRRDDPGGRGRRARARLTVAALRDLGYHVVARRRCRARRCASSRRIPR